MDRQCPRGTQPLLHAQMEDLRSKLRTQALRVHLLFLKHSLLAKMMDRSHSMLSSS